jgi:hypothetical protein
MGETCEPSKAKLGGTPTARNSTKPRAIAARFAAAWESVIRSRLMNATSTTRPVVPPCQRLVGLIALCPDCHGVKHLARTRLVSIEQGDPSIYENALRHLAAVNGWDDARVQAYLSEANELLQRREALGTWVQDFSAFPGE